MLVRIAIAHFSLSLFIYVNFSSFKCYWFFCCCCWLVLLQIHCRLFLFLPLTGSHASTIKFRYTLHAHYLRKTFILIAHLTKSHMRFEYSVANVSACRWRLMDSLKNGFCNMYKIKPKKNTHTNTDRHSLHAETLFQYNWYIRFDLKPDATHTHRIRKKEARERACVHRTTIYISTKPLHCTVCRLIWVCINLF